MNETHRYQLRIRPPARTQDIHGSGDYGALRGGDRTHNGIDIACYPGSIIHSIRPGVVTKHGWPYSATDKQHLRYIEVTDPAGYRLRYFYVQPIAEINRVIRAGDEIGISQRLTDVYPGITEHVHFEVIHDGRHINPEPFLTGMAR
jgi:murein DD-endopeptidase MepM/ murein hydrolase activator NlpD